MLVDNQNAGSANKRSLILAGGGMRLAYQAGVMMVLEEEGLTFQHVDGTSGGIFNTAMLASGLDPNQIAENWRTLNVKWFVSMRKFRNYFTPLFMKGYTDADNIRDKVFPHLGIDFDKINHNHRINATFNVCNFADKSVEVFKHTEVKTDHLLAGVSLPIVMPALNINDKWYTDAVWIKDANISEAINQGSNEIWLVWAIGNTREYLPGMLNQYVHMIEMSANGALLEEYKQIRQLQESSRIGKVKFYVIKPKYPIPLDPDLFFNKIDTRSLINMGYADARDCLSSMPAEGVKMDSTATMMRNPGKRLNFRSVFEGMVNWEKNTGNMKFFCYFRLSEISGRLELAIFASIRLEFTEEEFPLYDSKVNISKEKGRRYLFLKSRFQRNGNKFQLEAKWPLGSSIDILLGLGFKSVHITVTRPDGPVKEICSADLFQSVKNRIRNLVTMNIRTEQGRPGGIFKKYRMLTKLESHVF